MSGGDGSSPSAIVVGGGPAGLVAAERLAGDGFAVTVFEHKRSLGRKFLLAGRGGLNITHSEPLVDFVSRYGAGEEHLAAALAAFGPSDLRAWCAGLDEPTFVGSSGRVFPDSLRATPLLRAWLRRLAALGVGVRLGHRWSGFASPDSSNACVFTKADGENVTSSADVVVLAMGGASWPRVGSDGGWVEPLREAGAHVVPLAAANCGVEVNWTAELTERFEGQPLKNVAMTVAGRTVRGDCVVTSTGLEGGPVYAHSAALRAELGNAGGARLDADLSPDLAIDQLTERLSNRRAKESTSTWLRKAGFSPLHIAMLREVTGNQLPQAPAAMAALAKRAPIAVQALMPIERAISTAGGVSFDQLDANFMLRERPGVFVAGEMLDWEAPTGGYLLQACFSTGVAAANGAMEWLRSQPGRA